MGEELEMGWSGSLGKSEGPMADASSSVPDSPGISLRDAPEYSLSPFIFFLPLIVEFSKGLSNDTEQP